MARSIQSEPAGRIDLDQASRRRPRVFCTAMARPRLNLITLSGRGAVVTGGARGIGAAIAKALLAAGAQAHVFDLTEPEPGASSSFHKVDVANPLQVRAAVAALPPGSTLLVNNAGITRDRTLIKRSDDEWDSVLAVKARRALGHRKRGALPVVGRSPQSDGRGAARRRRAVPVGRWARSVAY